jgi:cytochrome c oxidase assembly factor CtaG
LGWHDPNAYNAALRYDWVHDLEHLTFFGTALLFWWHVTQMAPRIHGRFSRGARIAYLFVTVPVNMLTGVAIAFSSEPIYTYYTAVPRLWGTTVMQDQMLGGIIMWIPGSMMYIIAALILIAGLVRAEERKQPMPESAWATDEAMIAPGWKK